MRTASPRSRFVLAGTISVWAIAGCQLPFGGPASGSYGLAGPGGNTNVDRAQGSAGERRLASHAATADAAGAVLVVNGERITAAQLWHGAIEEVEQKARTLSAPAYQAYVEQRAATLITDKIAEMLLHQVAVARNGTENSQALDRFVDEQIRKIVTADFGGTQRRYEKHLQAQGRTLDDVRNAIRREIVIAQYLDAELKPKLPEPTRAELYSAFQANIDQWRRPARRKMSLIDVRLTAHLPPGVDQPTREQMAEARQKARQRIEAAREELLGGAEFAEAARRYSDGLNAAEGGAWGWVTKEGVRSRFLPAVEAVERLAPGETSDVIEAVDGFFLVRCDAFEPPVEPDFPSVQPELRERYLTTAFNRLVGEKVQELQFKARIEPADLRSFHVAAVAAAPPHQLLSDR
jgi:parvulin-like peptidyl-prolyl isomerase